MEVHVGGSICYETMGRRTDVDAKPIADHKTRGTLASRDLPCCSSHMVRQAYSSDSTVNEIQLRCQVSPAISDNLVMNSMSKNAAQLLSYSL